MHRVLLVEDDASLRLLTRLVLERSDEFEVVGEASDGREGLDAAQRLRPDVVLLDLAMPGMDGFEALPHLRQRCPEAVVVALSMLQRDRHEPKAMALGAHAFLDKGLDSEALLSQLRHIVLRVRGATA